MALNKALFSSDKEDWATPQDFFDSLNEEFHFNLDPCADPENAKCDRFFTKEENGRMDQKVLQRSTKREYDRCCTHTGTH